MKLYRKIPLLEVVKWGPKNSMVRYQDGTGKMFIMSTKELEETFEEVGEKEKRDRELVRAALNGELEQADSKSGYKLEY